MVWRGEALKGKGLEGERRWVQGFGGVEEKRGDIERRHAESLTYPDSLDRI